MIIDLMSQALKIKKEPDLTKELYRINKALEMAKNEFNFSLHPLEIQAAIFRINELETRRSLIFVKAKLEKIEG